MWWNLAQFVARILGWGVTLKIMCKTYGGVIPKKLGWIGELVWKSSKLSHHGHRKSTPTPPSRVIIHQPLKRSAFILDHRFKLLNITYPILCSQSPAVWFFGLALTTLLSKRNTALEMTNYIHTLGYGICVTDCSNAASSLFAMSWARSNNSSS